MSRPSSAFAAAENSGVLRRRAAGRSEQCSHGHRDHRPEQQTHRKDLQHRSADGEGLVIARRYLGDIEIGELGGVGCLWEHRLAPVVGAELH